MILLHIAKIIYVIFFDIHNIFPEDTFSEMYDYEYIQTVRLITLGYEG